MMSATFIGWMTGLCGAALYASLFTLARIDWQTQRLPNGLTIPLIALGLVWSFGTQLDFYPHLLGAALGYGVFWAVEVAYRLIRKRDGLGRGDAKLLAAGGAWCGAWALPAIVLIGSVAALIYILPKQRSADARIPFGPFLAIGIGIVWAVLRVF